MDKTGGEKPKRSRKPPKAAEQATISGLNVSRETVEQAKAFLGRPTVYTKDLGDLICAELAEGKTLREVCRGDGMPSESTVRGWALKEDEELRPGFFAQYARAREIGYLGMFDELLEISDDGSNDWILRQGDDKETLYVLNGEHVQRSRLRVDTRKWALSKALPKIYGDRTTQVHEAGDTLQAMMRQLDGKTRGLPNGGAA